MRHSFALFASLAAFIALPALAAQASPVPTPTSSPRAALEARLVVADSLSRVAALPADQREQRRREAALIRERLRDGDFQVGDRVIVRVRGLAFARDTFVVETGRVLRLPELPEVSLTGVLYGELPSHLSRHVAAFVREPSVEAYALVRLAILGEIARPGFYFFRSDVPLTDALMLAGGPTGGADLARSIVKRGEDDLLSRAAVADALRGGRTLEQLDLRAGDEIVVGTRKEGFGVQRGMQVLASVAALAAVIVTLGNR